MNRPILLLTMGDVAGVGPEIIAKGWPQLIRLCRPVVVGDPQWMRRGLEFANNFAHVAVVDTLHEVEPTPELIPIIAASDVELTRVKPATITAEAGQAAYDFLCRAIDETLDQQADGIVTAPLHKEGFRLAGVKHPGHTEILAERTGTANFGMMLYARNATIPQGLAVVHVTLHCALRDVFAQISTQSVEEKIQLVHSICNRLSDGPPRIAVAALNPHASDGGLFGNEEQTIISPAVESARRVDIDVTGPLPSDTLFQRAVRGDFDGIVCMYHDQGHIPMKLLGGFDAVNISVGLPIVRTSVAHGTAYDIAGKGIADPASLIEATRVAALLTRRKPLEVCVTR
ncbi:MAG: 4-hydroxythreonine-4-phosphate dehydrogenase PdxA [Gemmataceae bacterium]